MGACAVKLAAIAKECAGGNAPGFSTDVYIVERDDVTAIPAPTNHDIATDITMVVAKVFFTWSVSKGDQQLITAPEGEDENITYKTTFQCFIAKATAAKSDVLNDTTGAEFLMIVTDKKGQQILLGNLTDGVSLKVQQQTTDKHGYLITAEWESNHLPYYYSGVIAT